MEKFKVGDKVRVVGNITNAAVSQHSIPIGTIVELTFVSDKKCGVTWRDMINYTLLPEEIELVEEKESIDTEHYNSLMDVLFEAFNQASRGKGKVRHAEKDEDFEDQLICTLLRWGCNHSNGQAIKKIVESIRLRKEYPEAAVQELLGAINYIAADVIVLREG
ncbi:MAG: hypothetical protein ABH983_01965 [Candidatus Micrarchaeota archaeon]